MPVIVSSAARPAFPRWFGMRIIEADDACARLIMQGEAIAQSVWPLPAWRHSFGDEPDRVIPARIDDESFAIKVE